MPQPAPFRESAATALRWLRERNKERRGLKNGLSLRNRLGPARRLARSTRAA
jgi:hypothetical protein